MAVEIAEGAEENEAVWTNTLFSPIVCASRTPAARRGVCRLSSSDLGRGKPRQLLTLQYLPDRLGVCVAKYR